LAGPRKKNGYTAIAHEILEALAHTKMTAEARQVFDAVLRRTYGWNRKHALITYRQFSEATGLSPAHVYRALRSLLEHKFIEKSVGGYSVREDYEKWVPYSKRGVPSSGAENTPCKEYSPAPEGEDAMPIKPAINNALRMPKESIENNINKSLCRRRLLEILKCHFPDVRIPGYVPSEKIDLFIFKIDRREIIAGRVNNPVAYIMSLKSEQFPSLFEREEKERQREAKRLEDLRKEKKEFEKHRQENNEEMRKLISSYRAQLEGKNAIEV